MNMFDHKALLFRAATLSAFNNKSGWIHISDNRHNKKV